MDEIRAGGASIADAPEPAPSATRSTPDSGAGAAPLPAEIGEDAGDAGNGRRDVIRRRDTRFRRALGVADAAAVAIAVSTVAALAGDDRLTVTTVAVPLVFVVIVKAMGLYDRDQHVLHRATLDEVPALFGLATLAALLIWLSNGLIVEGDLDRGQVLVCWSLLLLLLVCLRATARALTLRTVPVERCLLVGDPATATYLREKLAMNPGVAAELVGVVPLDPTHRDASTPDLPHGLGPALEAHAVERVVIAIGPSGRDELLYTIRELKEYGVKVSVLPEASRVAGSSVELDHLHGLTLLGMRRFEFTRSSRMIKRAFDVFGASLALAVSAPLLLAVYVAIRLDSGGPVFFSQRRVGRHGDEFQMLKFRTMVNKAEQLKDELRHLNEGAEGLFKISGDPRVTRVGRWLRPWQLDELPQLINVLRGEMSLVGPRPLVPEEDRQIEGWYRRRLDVPPGITGHWQILGSSQRIPLNEMVKLDYLYVANWSPWGDVRLLLRTIPFVLRRGGM